MSFRSLVVATLAVQAAYGLFGIGDNAAPQHDKSLGKAAQATGREAQEVQRQAQDNERRKQNRQHGQQQQQDQQEQGNQRKYIEEYVPKAFQKFAFKDDHRSNNSIGGDQTLNLLELPSAPLSSGQTPTTQGSGESKGHYEHYIKKYAGKNGYQQYMSKYAAKYTTGSSNYSQYMKNYAGGDYQDYADYQKYIQRYSRGNDDDVVSEARDAQNLDELNKWKSHEEQSVHWYVPTEYDTYADKHIQKQYDQRLSQLQSQHQQKKPESQSDSPFQQALINLVAMPKSAQKQALEQRLRQDSEAGVEKAERLGEDLKKASRNTESIETMAARPGNNVATSFTDRAQALETKVQGLQKQVKSRQTSADFASQVRHTVAEVKSLRDDQFKALRQAYHEANAATRHATRGAQNQVREEARKVWALSDRLEAKNQSDQDLTNKLQSRVEAAADNVENYSEELARRTDDRTREGMSKAKDMFRREAHSRLDALHEVEAQFQELQKASASQTFLAQYSDTTQLSVGPLTPLALVSGGFLTLWFVLMFIGLRNRRRVDVPKTILG